MGTNQGGQGGGSEKKAASLTLKQGETTSASGYMVASGEGKMACQIGDVVVEGDYEGSEGDPCTANISVE